MGFSAIEENLACLLRAGVNAGAPNLLWGTTGAPRGTGGCISVCFEWRRSWRLQLCCAGYKNPVLRVNVRRSEHPLPRVPSDRGLEFRDTEPSRLSLRARAVGSHPSSGYHRCDRRASRLDRRRKCGAPCSSNCIRAAAQCKHCMYQGQSRLLS